MPSESGSVLTATADEPPADRRPGVEPTLELQDSQEPLFCARDVSDEQLFPYTRPGFTVISTRPQPVSRAAVPLTSLACGTGPSEPRTTPHSPGDERLGAACRLATRPQGEAALLSPTATTGHLLDGSPTSNLPRNCRAVRSHSPARMAHRTSGTQRTRRACRIPFAQAGIRHQRIGSCSSPRTTGPALL